MHSRSVDKARTDRMGVTVWPLCKSRETARLLLCVCVTQSFYFGKENHRAYLICGLFKSTMLLCLCHISVPALDLCWDNVVTKEMTCKHNQSSQGFKRNRKQTDFCIITKLMFDKEKNMFCAQSLLNIFTSNMRLSTSQINFKQEVNTLRCIVLCTRIK